MSKKYIKTKKVVIPLLTLVMLSSQLMGCAALNSKELVEEMRESKEVEIEYNELERDNIELTKIGVNEDTTNTESTTNKEESPDIVIDSTGTADVVQTSLSAEQASAEQAEQERLAAEQAAAKKAEQAAAKKAEQAAQQAAAKKAEQERLAAQQAEQQAAAKKAEQERLAAQQAAEKAEQERLAAEQAKQQQQAAQQQQQTQTSITPTTFDTPSNTGKVGITAEDFVAGNTEGELDLDGFTVLNDPKDQPSLYGG